MRMSHQSGGLGWPCGLQLFFGSSCCEVNLALESLDSPSYKQGLRWGGMSTLRAGTTLPHPLPWSHSIQQNSCIQSTLKNIYWFYNHFYRSCLDMLIYMLNHKKKGTSELF